MADVIGQAAVEVIPETRRFAGQATSEVQGALGGVRKSLGGIRNAFIGAFAGTAAVQGIRGVIGQLSSAIGAASDLGETISKTGQIFGREALPELQKFAGQAAKSLGQSKQEALDAAATFGVFGKSAGLSGQELVGFSTELTTLASDMASFSNTTPQDAINALGAALRGENEPIRRYGVLLDDVTLRQEALALGLIKTTQQALTPQQKVLAAQAAVLKQTGDQQGDFARTSGGLANQQRILAAQFQNAKVTIGNVFLPAITTVVSFLNQNLFPALSRVGDFIKGVIEGFRGGGDAGTKFSSSFTPVLNLFKTLVPIIRDFVTQVGAVLGPALRQLGSIVTGQLIPAFNAILPVVTPVARFLLSVIATQVVAALRGAVNVIIGVFKVITGVFQVFAGLFTGDWSKMWQGIKNIIGGVFQAIKGLVQVFLNIGILAVFRRILVGALRGVVSLAFSGIKALFSAGLNVLKTVTSAAFRGILSAIRGGLNGSVSLVRGLPQRILGALGNLGKLLFNAGVRIIQGLIDGIKSKIASVGKAIGSVAKKIRDALPFSPAKEGPLSGRGDPERAGRTIAELIAEGLRSRLPEIAGALTRGLTPTVSVAPAVAAAFRVPVAAAAAATPTAGAPPLDVRVFIGDRELTDIVRVEMGERNRDVRRRASAGSTR